SRPPGAGWSPRGIGSRSRVVSIGVRLYPGPRARCHEWNGGFLPRSRGGGIPPVEQHEQHRDHGEDEQARLDPARPARQPIRPGERRSQQVVADGPASVARVGRADDRERGVVEPRVESDGEPQAAGAPQRQAQKQTDQPDAREVRQVLHRLEEVVQPAEHEREQRGRPPEADPRRQRELRVAAERELLGEGRNDAQAAHRLGEHEPGRRPLTAVAQTEHADHEPLQGQADHALGEHHEQQQAPAGANPLRADERAAQRGGSGHAPKLTPSRHARRSDVTLSAHPDHPHPGNRMPDHQPYVPAAQSPAELTGRALVLGSILGLIFGASNVYLALKIGLTVSASIPIAVLSITIFRAIGRATILENNIVQTTGSAADSVSAGVVFTIPAILLMGYDLDIGRVAILAMAGGLMGILMLIPLRRALMLREHVTLPYPEGTACAEVLIAGEEGGVHAKTVFQAFGLAFVYKFLMTALKLWQEYPGRVLRWFQGAEVRLEAAPELMGVGYIIGPRIAGYLFAGGCLAYLVLMPAIKLFGAAMTTPMYP